MRNTWPERAWPYWGGIIKRKRQASSTWASDWSRVELGRIGRGCCLVSSSCREVRGGADKLDGCWRDLQGCQSLEGFHTDGMGSRRDRSVSSGVTFIEECEIHAQYVDRNLSNGLVQESMIKGNYLTPGCLNWERHFIKSLKKKKAWMVRLWGMGHIGSVWALEAEKLIYPQTGRSLDPYGNGGCVSRDSGGNQSCALALRAIRQLGITRWGLCEVNDRKETGKTGVTGGNDDL